MKISDHGLAFLAGHEGFVSRAYLDPVGVLTIGYGFTMRGRVFSSYWRGKHGRSLKMSDTISRAEADTVLRTLVAEEYGAAVNQALPGLKQHEFDACSSVVYNLGPGALKWKWAQALKRGDVSEAARLLAVTGTTAKGRKLPGLVRRRREESDLLKYGRYPGGGHGSRPVVDDSIRQLQSDLKRLGFVVGSVDGQDGPVTQRAVKLFQAQNPPLAVDGIAGPATRAAIDRALTAKPVTETTFLETIVRIIAGLFGAAK